jgi:hypothetical protein
MDAVAPDAFKVFISRIAPTMIIRTSTELSIPKTELARTASISTSQKMSANTADITQEMRRHHLAGQLKTVIKTRVAKMGKNATSANIVFLQNTVKKIVYFLTIKIIAHGSQAKQYHC